MNSLSKIAVALTICFNSHSLIALMPVADFGEYYNNPGPPLSDSDESIRQSIRLALNGTSSVDASNVQFSVENGKVTLTGTVSSDSDKSIIESVVNAVTGVTWVENRLIVSG